MLNKIKNYTHILPWPALRDPRTLGQVVFLIIVLLISWSGVKTIQTNYGLQKQIATLQQQNKVTQLQNQNQGLENQYYSSNQYLELSARQELGLGMPGETELIVPKNVALAHLANLPSNTSNTPTNTTAPWYSKNLKAWLDFFWHRQPSTN